MFYKKEEEEKEVKKEEKKEEKRKTIFLLFYTLYNRDVSAYSRRKALDTAHATCVFSHAFKKEHRD